MSFERIPNVSVVHGRFQDVDEFDCVVSPANSYGLMDGGFDAHLVHFFGLQLMERVQQHIIDHYAGSQPVGTSFLVATGNERHPFVAHTPTMRVPMVISGTDNVYQAMKAMLLAVKAYNKNNARQIQKVLCPGLGTATGGVPFSIAAAQMRLAYEHVCNDMSHIDWNFAIERERLVSNSV